MLKPEVSLTVGLATAAVVYGLYQNATPTIADIRVSEPQDATIDGTRKMAAWTTAAIVGAVSLISKDPTVFILGGTMIVALDWWHRHANAFDPEVNRVVSGVSPAVNQQVMSTGTAG
jgi:hypothetical protein